MFQISFLHNIFKEKQGDAMDRIFVFILEVRVQVIFEFFFSFGDKIEEKKVSP
jgi:hypothetical protein